MAVSYVVTTIQSPSEGVRAIADALGEQSGAFFVIGDRKSPPRWDCPGVSYFGIADQRALDFSIVSVLGEDTYSRKMVGYLLAVSSGAVWIRETDDDNNPYESFFAPVPGEVRGRTPQLAARFINIYNYFSDRHVWPRGLPLTKVRPQSLMATLPGEASGLVVFQALADGDPDVDAVYRLTAPDASDVMFSQLEPLIIPQFTWTPFNSQATTWPRELLPLMYLPSTCSFRMTDIWRSYIAQRLMPGLGATLVITGPTVFQDRNEHDLMRDFRDEIEGYIGYERFVQTLEETTVGGTTASLLSDLRVLYMALISDGFFTYDELEILDAWIADMETLGYGPVA